MEAEVAQYFRRTGAAAQGQGNEQALDGALVGPCRSCGGELWFQISPETGRAFAACSGTCLERLSRFLPL